MQKRIFSILLRWSPALLVMVVIFYFSSRRSVDLPNFDSFDYIVKKSGHMIGYGSLTLSYLYALNRRDGKSYYIAWLLAILYAITDEYHQSFVAGRNPSFWDIMLFDNFGAILALYFSFWKNRK